MTLTIGSLFSGIGGLELGLERGLGDARTVWQVEQSEYCRRVLEKHWPTAIRHEDIRNVGRFNLQRVGVLCGGFPCQPHSLAGKRKGAADERYLWPEFARVVGELRPRYVVVENVANILADGTAFRVLGDFAALGYDAEWSVVSACSVGAAHMRERVFIVAYPECDCVQGWPALASQGSAESREEQLSGLLFSRFEDAVSAARVWRAGNGVPHRLDVSRNRAVGNAVVPQVAEVVGRLIAQREAERLEAA